MAKGSAQPNLSPVETGASMLLIPTRKILDDFNELVDSIYRRIIQKIYRSPNVYIDIMFHIIFNNSNFSI